MQSHGTIVRSLPTVVDERLMISTAIRPTRQCNSQSQANVPRVAVKEQDRRQLFILRVLGVVQQPRVYLDSVRAGYHVRLERHAVLRGGAVPPGVLRRVARHAAYGREVQQ